jgi:hypothetical protein
LVVAPIAMARTSFSESSQPVHSGGKIEYWPTVGLPSSDVPDQLALVLDASYEFLNKSKYKLTNPWSVVNIYLQQLAEALLHDRETE